MFLLLKLIFGLAISYLIGSIPTAYLFGKAKGIDIRQQGSGNVGATNAIRVLGKVPGIAVLVIDVIKGIIPTAIIADVLGLDHIIFRVLLAVAVVCGHNWTVFLNFKGGKGIATSLGVLIGLAIRIAPIRPVLFFSVTAWLVTFFITGYVSLASMVAAVVLPLVSVATGQPLALTTLGIIFCIFVVFRHRPNIKRLLAGKENRVQILKKKTPSP